MNYGCCKYCNKGIRYDKMCMCDECRDKFLHKVKDYIYANGVKTASEISHATGVPFQVIIYLLNNGYLTTSSKKDDYSKLTDEEILKKQEQLALIEALKDSFNTNIEPEKEEKYAKPEMHFMNRNRGR